MELFFKCVWNNRFLKKDNIIRFFFSLAWLQKMSVGHRALWACCRGNITAVSWCVFILSSSSLRAEPHSQTRCLLLLFGRKCFDVLYVFTKQTQKAREWSRICDIIHTCTVTFSWAPAAGAGLSTASPVHLGIASLLPCPHLFSSQGQGDPLYDGTPFITAGTITGDVSLSENFKPILPPHLSLSLSSVSACVSFLFGSHTLLFFPSP